MVIIIHILVYNIMWFLFDNTFYKVSTITASFKTEFSYGGGGGKPTMVCQWPMHLNVYDPLQFWTFILEILDVQNETSRL